MRSNSRAPICPARPCAFRGAADRHRGSAVFRNLPATAAAFETTIQPFLENHCYDCHDARRHKADLNLEKFQTADDVTANPDTWDEVLLKLRTGEMPPEDEIRPEPADLARVTTWIADRIAEADARALPDPGRVIVRRLNRAEYNNTVRDLVGVDSSRPTTSRRTIPATGSTRLARCCRYRRS